MKYIHNCCIIILSLLAVTLSGQSDPINVPFSNPSAEKYLDLSVLNAEITIIGKDRDDVLIAYEEIEYDDEEREEEEEDTNANGLKKISGSNLDLTIGERNNKVYVNSNNWNKALNMTIEVPKNIEINVNSNMGRMVKASDISGDINIECAIGSIDLTGIDGIVNASTATGKINIAFNSIPSDKSMIITNHTGSIDLTMPASHKADLKMKTNWGEIYSDLAIQTEVKQPEVMREADEDGMKIKMDNWTHATLNGGGPQITLQSQMGNIYLRKKS